MKTKIDRDLLRDLQRKCAAVKPTATFDVLDTELPGFLVRVTPSGSMTYGIRYTNKDGKQRRYTLRKNFPTTAPSTAREEARIQLGKISAGDDPSEAKRDRTNASLTLRKFLIDKYTDYLVTNTKTGKLRAKAIASAFPMLLDKPLSEISGEIIEKWRAQRIKAGISPSTTNRNITALRGLFSRAVDWNVIPKHPLSKVKILKEPSGKVRWLSVEEEKNLRSALDRREDLERQGRENANNWRSERGYELLPDLRKVPFVDHLKPMVIISINTGVRRGELLKLRWEHVDLANAILTLYGENTKTSETRHIPLNSEALTTLMEWKQQANHELVFPGPTGGAMTTLKTSWGSLLLSAQIENFRWHDMRHHFASRLVMAGVDLNTVRELLGHSDIKMTLRYAHLAPEHKAAAVQKLMRTI